MTFSQLNPSTHPYPRVERGLFPTNIIWVPMKIVFVFFFFFLGAGEAFLGKILMIDQLKTQKEGLDNLEQMLHV